jgi:peptidase M23-like protein
VSKARATFTRPVPQATGTPFGKAGPLWSSGHHTGLDFPAPTGQTVVACLGGKVTSARTAGAYGNRVVIRHALGFETWYCHLSAFAVKAGDVVNAGQAIGRVGATGNVTGPHLHLEVRLNGSAVDPAPYINGSKAGPSSTTSTASTGGAAQLGTTRPGAVASASWSLPMPDIPGIPDPSDLGDIVGGARDLTLTALVVLGGLGLVVVGVLAAAAPRIKRESDEAMDKAKAALMLTPGGAALKGAGAAGGATTTTTKGKAR